MLLLNFFSFCLSFLLIRAQKSDWECKSVASLVEFKLSNTSILATYKKIDIYHQYVDCKNCDLVYLSSLDPSIGIYVNYSQLDAHFDYYFEVRSSVQDYEILCSKFVYKNFGECGQYRFDILDKEECKITNTIEPNDIYATLAIGLSVILVLIIISNLLEKFYTKLKNKLVNWIKTKISGKVKSEDSIELSVQNNIVQNHVVKRPRYRSVDAFRGLSITIMIFVTYGYATFDFLYHVPWNGFNLSSLVFPWFLFIMGFNIPLSIHSAMKKPGARRVSIFYKILVRTVKLFLIGLFLNTNYEFDFDDLRIFGVLQRIGLCFFILSVTELVLYTNIDVDKYKNSKLYYLSDHIYSWPHTLVALGLLTIWVLLTYLLPVPGCPTGYLGPGGLSDYSEYWNCSGGAAAYIDDLILGKGHQYKYPTHIQLYKKGQFTLENRFDPEGILGTLASCFCTYFGLIAGRVVIFYKKQIEHMIIWFVWVIITLVCYAILTGFDIDDGIIQVNKNIWTPSFTFVSVTFGFGILIILYFIIDYKKWWNGNPFIYPGTNSILLYALHYVFSNTFPVQWKMPNLHVVKFYMCIWGVSFWTAVAAYLFNKEIFFNV